MMETARIYTLLAIENHLILVFYTQKRGYQFRVVALGGEVFGNQDVFDSEVTFGLRSPLLQIF